MNTQAVAQMLRKDREEWAALAALLDADPERRVHQDGGDWIARDVYAHFARWLQHSTNDLEAGLRGETIPRPEGTDDEINAHWQAEDSKLTLEEARDWARREVDRHLTAIESVPADRWDDTLWAIARADGHEHIAAHRLYVEGG